ncbi:MAG: hypothetical protein KDI62_24480, partial [Anaerolineae bacterium]|nr:hypothetical protein [Anaerolineae bacterium]
MAESKDLVRVVYYVFNPEYLFLNFSDLNRYKVDECIQEYTRLCQEELLNSYPQAEVVVNEGSTIEIYVEALDDKFEQTPDPSEQNVIEVICNRIYDSHNWVKIRDYIPVIEVKNRTKIPLPVIRWGCKQKLIEGVNNSTGRWDIVLSDIPEMEELIFIIDGHIPIQLPSTQIAAITCYLEDYNNISVMDIPENTSLLVASIEGFDEKLFTADNALWEIYRKGNQIDLEIEHFNDIVT